MLATQVSFNPLTSTDPIFLNDPYPVLQKMRAETPVCWSKKNKYWLISRHAEVSAILRDTTFEKQIQTWKHAPNPLIVSILPHIKSISGVSNNWLLNLNPPNHGRVRSLLNKAFTGQVVRDLRPTIEALSDDLIAKIAARSAETNNAPFDLIEDFAIPLPMAVIGHMLGIPPAQEGQLKDWSTKLAAVAGRHTDLKVLIAAGKAVEALTAYLRPAIEERRRAPKDDLLSTLVQAEMDGDRLKTEELVGNCILLLIAGHETTTNLIGNALYSLVRNAEQMAILSAHLRQEEQGSSTPSPLMTSTIAEVLRYESPAQTAPRLATVEVEMAGQTVRPGDMCWLLLGSANRDEQVFADAARFDINRAPSNQMLSFGAGIHRCIGASLAEVELEIALSKLFAWREAFALGGSNSNGHVDFRVPFTLRGPQALWLQ
ncbi:MAG: cytochrome P450 [Cyanobacteria bacterium REEB67]|nr:cytochrome P450 [Cyanobacteria bacterium REEB67]